VAMSVNTNNGKAASWLTLQMQTVGC